MEENSPDFKVEISTSSPTASTTKEAIKPSKTKRPLRKVHRSNLGIFYTLLHILGQLAALVIGGWALYCYLENEGDEHYILGNLRWLTGLPENSVLAQEEEQMNFVIAALVCFAFGSLLQFFVVFSVIMSPRFLAKNPSLSTFWPMAISFLLRIASEALYQCTDTMRHYKFSILWISLSLAYCVLVVDGYWYDDDDPPKIFRLKPWYVEPFELPK